MHHRLHREIRLWVLLLRFIAGYLNVATILLYSQMLAGQTGRISSIVISLVETSFDNIPGALILFVAFFVGIILSGYLFPSSGFNPQSRFAYTLMIIAVFLVIISVLELPILLELCYVAFVLGLQNGMFVFYRGMVVRTTILTGTITDIGTSIGRRLKGINKNIWKTYFHIANTVSFMFGCLLAASFHYFTERNILLIAGILYFVIGIYFLWIRSRIHSTIKKKLYGEKKDNS